MTERIDAWRNLLLAQHRVLQAIEVDLRDAGVVALSWYDVLLELSTGDLRMQDLGARVVLSRSRVSRLVDDLEAAGLVERRPDPVDGRATLACMTPAGRRAFRQAAPVYLEAIERHFTSHLSTRQREAIARGLGVVVAAHEGS